MGFIDENFLLKTKTAQKLFHEYAKSEPIYDFHCHLNPQEIYENKNFSDITEVWLGGDHYKWRAMRSLGIPEEKITGKDVDSFEKFEKWAETIQYAIGNPLYHWTHLELQRFFGIYEPLTKKSARKIYDQINEKLAKPEFKVRELIKMRMLRLSTQQTIPQTHLNGTRKLPQTKRHSRFIPLSVPTRHLISMRLHLQTTSRHLAQQRTQR